MCDPNGGTTSTRGIKKVVVLDTAGKPILLAPRLQVIIGFLVSHQEVLITDTLQMNIDCKGSNCVFRFPQVYTLQAVG